MTKYEMVEKALEKCLDQCTGRGLQPWTVTIIDYYGPGCTLGNGSTDQIAILPHREGKYWHAKFVSLEHVAQHFASKENAVTLIFNHSSTHPLGSKLYR
jgi:hypothetical protein